MSGTKLSFSIKSQKKPKVPATNVAPSEFEAVEDSRFSNNDNDIHPDLPREPLVIPVQKDGRQSLQEQARLRRLQQQQQQQQQQQEQQEQQEEGEEQQHQQPKVDESKDQEDQAAIDALNAQAGRNAADDDGSEQASKLIIAGSKNTFQWGGKQKMQETEEDADAKQLRLDLEHLAPEVTVDSHVYRQVPISDFGAAMLRGMGWTGQVDTSDRDSAMNLPRPSRLGLGATPKLLDIPTHGRKPLRQDQVQREEQLKQQQEEFERKRLEQIKLDKQLTIQDGSVIRECNHKASTRRGIIRKFQGVPGLNMILVQFEDEKEAVKVRKGDVQLVGREELLEKPFQEPEYIRDETQTEYLGQMTSNAERRREKEPSRDKDQRLNEDKDKRKKYSGSDEDRRRYSRDVEERNDSRNSKKRRDDGEHRGEHRKRHKEDDPPSQPVTWLIPHIRVRVITSKYGKDLYKEKGVVVDVSRKGTATLTMGNGRVIQVPERYLETALPKVGGNACILTGKHRLAKGCLLERDSKANRGSIQVFEDMNIVTTSLDDMAEWCGPLDDDLME